MASGEADEVILCSARANSIFSAEPRSNGKKNSEVEHNINCLTQLQHLLDSLGLCIVPTINILPS